MTSKKRINKYKQAGKMNSVNSLQNEPNPIPFRRPRRHSCFGALVNNDNSYSLTNGFAEARKNELSFDALDLKQPESPSLFEKAVHAFGFSADAVSH